MTFGKPLNSLKKSSEENSIITVKKNDNFNHKLPKIKKTVSKFLDTSLLPEIVNKSQQK